MKQTTLFLISLISVSVISGLRSLGNNIEIKSGEASISE